MVYGDARERERELYIESQQIKDLCEEKIKKKRGERKIDPK